MTYPIVDYFSFSVPTPCLITQWETSARLDMGNLFDDRTSDLLSLFASQKNWREYNRSGLFNYMVRFDDIGMTYMEGDKCDVSLIQFSGGGCAWLRETGILEAVLAAWWDRTTRIDIAIDFESLADPEDFARQLSNRRFKSSAHDESITGKTWYVGSRSSERFARVYRYSDEMVRSNALRLEYQFSKHASRHATKSVIDDGILNVAIALGNLYGWLHKDYNLANGGEKFTSPTRPKARAGKEFWLYNQVLPSLIKEAEVGNIALLIDLKDKLCSIIDEYISFTEATHEPYSLPDGINDYPQLLEQNMRVSG